MIITISKLPLENGKEKIIKIFLLYTVFRCANTININYSIPGNLRSRSLINLFVYSENKIQLILVYPVKEGIQNASVSDPS